MLTVSSVFNIHHLTLLVNEYYWHRLLYQRLKFNWIFDRQKWAGDAGE